MSKAEKVSVTIETVIQRINRKLAEKDEQLRQPRSTRRERQNLGAYYVIDLRRNFVVDHHVDPEELGRDLGVLREWEQVKEATP